MPEAPGFEPAEVEVTLRGDVLAVRAEQTELKPAKGEVGERYARLERTMILPPEVETEKWMLGITAV